MRTGGNQKEISTLIEKRENTLAEQNKIARRASASLGSEAGTSSSINL